MYIKSKDVYYNYSDFAILRLDRESEDNAEVVFKDGTVQKLDLTEAMKNEKFLNEFIQVVDSIECYYRKKYIKAFETYDTLSKYMLTIVFSPDELNSYRIELEFESNDDRNTFIKSIDEDYVAPEIVEVGLVDESENISGHTPKELQRNIEIKGTGAKKIMTGELYHIDDYSQLFEKNSAGHYLCLYFEQATVEGNTVVVQFRDKKPATLTDDGIYIGQILKNGSMLMDVTVSNNQGSTTMTIDISRVKLLEENYSE